MHRYLAEIEKSEVAELDDLLLYLCAQFVRLRNASRVPLVRLIRMTLDQQAILIGHLLTTQSGGRLPVFLAAAMFETLRDRFGLNWTVEVQGINTADAATGAGGDIVVKDAGTGDVIVAVEVKEPRIDRSIVISTFGSKIATNRIAEYLFLYTTAMPTDDARRAAFDYFAQGHDIAFLRVDEWLRNCLGTVGAQGRQLFVERFLDHLGGLDVPSRLKLRWNELVRSLPGLAGSPEAS